MHDSVENRKSKPGSHAGRLCSEERVEDPQLHFRRDARSVVGDFQCYAACGNRSRPDPYMADVLCLEDGLFRIQNKGEQSLLNLCRVRDRFREMFIQLELNADISEPELVPTHLDHAVHYFIQVYPRPLAFASARKQQKIPGDASSAIPLFQDVPGFHLPLEISSSLPHQLGVTENAGERIVEFMCNA